MHLLCDFFVVRTLWCILSKQLHGIIVRGSEILLYAVMLLIVSMIVI